MAGLYKGNNLHSDRRQSSKATSVKVFHGARSQGTDVQGHLVSRLAEVERSNICENKGVSRR